MPEVGALKTAMLDGSTSSGPSFKVTLILTDLGKGYNKGMISLFTKQGIDNKGNLRIPHIHECKIVNSMNWNDLACWPNSMISNGAIFFQN